MDTYPINKMQKYHAKIQKWDTENILKKNRF